MAKWNCGIINKSVFGFLFFSRVVFAGGEGKYDLHILHADLERDNGRFECRLKEDGTGVELYTKAETPSIPLD